MPICNCFFFHASKMNGFMATLLKCTRTHWTSPQLTKRCFSKLDTKLKNIDQISTLHKSREDIASYVRFNRDFRVPSTDDFQELFSKSANSDKTEHELEEIRLKIGLICAEYEYFSFTNMRVPSALTCEDVRIMLNMNSNEARQMFFIKSYFRDTVRIRVKVKKIVKKSKKIEVNKEFMPGCFDGNGDLQYGLWKNCLFTRVNMSRQYRQRTQNAINSILWGQFIAFDWEFPEQALSEKGRPYSPAAAANRERYHQLMCYKIFKICNQIYKKNHHCHSPLSFVHCSMGPDSPMRKHLQETFDGSLLDSQFLECSANSYLNAFPGKRIIYINPLAKEVLRDEDINNQEETVFVFNPYQELMGLNRRDLNELYRLKIDNEEQGVHFRRLPIHDWIHHNNGHICLSHYIQGFADVLQGSTWPQVLKRYISKKHYKTECFIVFPPGESGFL